MSYTAISSLIILFVTSWYVTVFAQANNDRPLRTDSTQNVLSASDLDEMCAYETAINTNDQNMFNFCYKHLNSTYVDSIYRILNLKYRESKWYHIDCNHRLFINKKPPVEFNYILKRVNRESYLAFTPRNSATLIPRQDTVYSGQDKICIKIKMTIINYGKDFVFSKDSIYLLSSSKKKIPLLKLEVVPGLTDKYSKQEEIWEESSLRNGLAPSKFILVSDSSSECPTSVDLLIRKEIVKALPTWVHSLELYLYFKVPIDYNNKNYELILETIDCGII